MNSRDSLLHDALSKNRAEEIGYDVWQHFVVPPFYDKLDLEVARKPRVIIGGRGCGKTMLLRYFSHQSKFSLNRKEIPDNAASHIGLYWRADTQFCNAMVKRGITEETWQSAFNHFGALSLGMELIKSLRSIAMSAYPNFSKENLQTLNFTPLGAFYLDANGSVDELHAHLQKLMWNFDGWVNDVKKVKEPNFLPGTRFLQAVVSIVRQQIPALVNSTFYVYLDEYENLCDYQKRIINTWLKHSESPLIFNLAIKRNSFENKQTVGPESISDIHDLRQHDLEAYLLEEDFPVFAAEILFLKLSFADFRKEDLPISPQQLRDPLFLPERRKASYIAKVSTSAQKLLPGLTHRQLAQLVFEDKRLYELLSKRVRQALSDRRSNLPIQVFLRKEYPEASIVNSVLLFRKRLRPDEIVLDMKRLEAGEENRFAGRTNWIHNNFVGSLLNLYAPYSRPCPFYGGFKTFCELSHGNLRHFLELCHKSFSRSARDDGTIELPVDPEKQAEAARQASADFLGEVRSFGPLGNKLYTFVLRLGSLFALAHQRATQSESEQSHFSITRGVEELSQEDLEFFREAGKWSVLFEDPETKKKHKEQPEGIEYVLNPIYSPYFHISYRKKKKLELSTLDVICLIRGNLEDFKTLMKRFSKKWFVEKDDVAPTLFSLLDTEGGDED